MSCNNLYSQNSSGYMQSDQAGPLRTRQAPVSSGMPAQSQMTRMQSQRAARGVSPVSPLTSSLPSMQSGVSPLAGSMLPAPPNVRTPVTTSAYPVPGMETPITVQSPYYSAGFLKNFLGKDMKVEFLLGTSGALTDRSGTLMEVGASYIVLQPFLTDDLLMADLYSIKFVTIYA